MLDILRNYAIPKVMLEANFNSKRRNSAYETLGSLLATPTQIVELEYNPYDGSITATIYAITLENTIRFVNAPHSNPYYVD